MTFLGRCVFMCIYASIYYHSGKKGSLYTAKLTARYCVPIALQCETSNFTFHIFKLGENLQKNCVVWNMEKKKKFPHQTILETAACLCVCVETDSVKAHMLKEFVYIFFLMRAKVFH